MTAAYRIPIPARLRPLTAQIAQEYRDGASMADLAHRHRANVNAIGAILVQEGVERRPRGGNYAGQPHKCKRVCRLGDQVDGDRAIFARPVSRVLCPHGVTIEGKPARCVRSEDGVCQQCVAEHQASVTPRSGWGAEQNPHSAWRSAGGAA